MRHQNLEIINKFFEAFGKQDMAALNELVAPDIQWIFPGHHPLAGTKKGIEEVVNFFDSMGKIMEASNIKVERLVNGVNDDYVVECQHIWTNRKDGNNLDHYWCVLWAFRDGKITEGRHLASDQHLVDSFFCKVY